MNIAVIPQCQNSNVVTTVLVPEYVPGYVTEYICNKNDKQSSITLAGVKQFFVALSTAELPASPTGLGTHIKTTLVPSKDIKPRT